MHRLEFCASSWCTHIFKAIKMVNNHLAYQWHHIGKFWNANSAFLTTFLSAMLIGLNVASGSCILKLIGQKFIFFLCLCFHFSWKHVVFTWLTHAKKRSAAVWWKWYHWGRERERSIKAAEKYRSATIVASMHSTGATVVDSINATEFCLRQTQSPSFLLLLTMICSSSWQPYNNNWL